jgi:beta-phosphoglucomutase-like phosphatase (HAD superfamily)
LAVADCIVFEDAASGVIAAKRGGFYCVGIGDAGSEDLAEADEIAADLGMVDLDCLRKRLSRRGLPSDAIHGT